MKELTPVDSSSRLARSTKDDKGEEQSLLYFTTIITYTILYYTTMLWMI